MSIKRLIARAGAVTVAAGVATLFSAGLASAHVTAKVIGETAEQGGYTKITFRVPSEEPTAGTVKLEVKFPADAPIASARTKPMPGWTGQVNRVTLPKPVEVHGAEVKEGIGSVVWTAQPGTRVNPGEFQEFELSVGPLPEVDELVVPAIQTYDNGTVVAWDQPAKEGEEEPEHPAPAIELAPESGEGHGHGSAAAADPESSNVEPAASSSTVSGTDDTARWLGGAGLAVGALGVGFGVGATLRARRANTTIRSEQ
jgi:periplasmic copper chaperone A